MRSARGRGLYPAVMGIAVGALVAGLLVPFIEGDRPGSTVAAGPTFTDRGETPVLDEDGTPVTSVDGSGSGDPTSPGGGPTASGPSGRPTGVDGAAPGGTDDSSGAPRTASDQGVTPDVINIAALLLDLGTAGRVGVNTTGVDPDQQRAAFEAYFKDINDRGGIHGRKVVGHYYTFDTTSPDDMLAACTFATEDVKAFMVMAMPGYGGAGGSATLCVTEQHRTPLIIMGQAVSRSLYNRSGGRLITLQMAGDRQMRNLAAGLNDAGLFKDRKLGILSGEEPQYVESIDRLLVPVLEEMGVDVVHVSHLARWPASQSQMPTEVQQMRTAGADTVLSVMSFLDTTPFVQTAEQQQWRPKYLISEYTGGTSDFEVQAMGSSFEGAIGFTAQRFHEWRANIPEGPTEARCRELYEKATGEQMPRNNGDQVNSGYPVINYACGFVRVFEAAAKAAGANLTRTALLEALSRFGQTEASFFFPGSFNAGKTDMVDFYRLIRFKASCRCWHVAGPVTPVRFR